MPTSAAASLLSRTESAGFGAFSDVSRSALPGTLATLAENSVMSVVSVAGSGPSRSTQTGRLKPTESAMPGSAFSSSRIAVSTSLRARRRSLRAPHAPETRAGRLVPDRRQHRIEGEAHEQRNENGNGDRQPELEEEAPDDAAHEGDGHEHRDDGKRRRHHREADLLGTFVGGA